MTARVLVIDDEEDLRALLKEALTDAGYTVADAATGDEGIALYRASPADLVITDVLMPKKVGLETIMELKRDFPDAKVIAISGGFNRRTDSDSTLAKTLGVDRTLSKPFSPETLLRVVREVLEEQASA
ncbi:MAG: response regulator [Verrucomicrobia bacterium]|nr:response regulator [Verrucomicrobiota bacterium]